MYCIRRLIFFFCALLFLTCPFAFGQFGDDECQGRDCPKDKEFTLDEVIVTAFHGGAVKITPTKTVIDIEAFDKSGAVERIEDILMHLTGIDVLRGSSGADPQTMVMMRGFDDSRFTIAIDGRTITGPTAGADTYVDWSSLTSADIEKIEVIRGAASAQYENSQGGIINIITRKGKARETLKPKITFVNDLSKFRTFTTRIAVDGGVKNLGYFFNYGYKRSDGYLLNNDYDGYDYSARLSYLFPFEGYLTLGLKYSQINVGYAVVNDPNSTYTNVWYPDYPIVPEDADTIRRFRLISFPGGDNYKDKHAQHLDLSFEQPFDKSKFKFQIFETSGAEDSYYYTVSGGALTQLYSGGPAREEKQIGGRLQYQMDFWDGHSVLTGYDQRRMETGSTEDVWRMQALYAEDTWSISEKLSAFLGLRYTHVRERTYAYADPGTTEKYRHMIYTKLFLPKSTFTYKFTDDTQLYLSINRDYHVPGCWDRPAWASFGSTEKGNEIHNETSWHYDLGVFHRPMKNLDTKLAFYYIDVDNYIVANSSDSFHNASTYGYNLKEMSFYGTELEFNAILFEKLTLFGNYTFRKTHYDPSKILAEAILLNIAPKHKANLGIRYSLFSNTLITSDIRFVGARKTEGNVMNLDSFTTVDVGFQHAYSENIVLRVYATNIFDKDYQEVYGFPMPGIAGGVNLKMTF